MIEVYCDEPSHPRGRRATVALFELYEPDPTLPKWAHSPWHAGHWVASEAKPGSRLDKGGSEIHLTFHEVDITTVWRNGERVTTSWKDAEPAVGGEVLHHELPCPYCARKVSCTDTTADPLFEGMERAGLTEVSLRTLAKFAQR